MYRENVLNNLQIKIFLYQKIYIGLDKVDDVDKENRYLLFKHTKLGVYLFSTYMQRR